MSTGKPDSSLRDLLFVAQCHLANGGGHRNQVGGDAGGRQVAAVEVGDAPPVRVEVGLGQDARHVRAHPHGGAEEVQLRGACTPARRRRP